MGEEREAEREERGEEGGERKEGQGGRKEEREREVGRRRKMGGGGRGKKINGCTFCREYLLSVLLHLTLNLLKGDPPENRDTTLGGNLASTLLKVRNTYSRHQRSSYSVREELQVICDGV